MPRLTTPKIKLRIPASIKKMDGVQAMWIVALLLVLLFVGTVMLGMFKSKALGGGGYTRGDYEFFANATSHLEGAPLDLVFVYSDACPHCTTFKPTFAKVESKVKNDPELSSRVRVQKVESKDPAFQKLSGLVEGFPTVLLMQNGRVIQGLVGNRGEKELEDFVVSNVLAK